MAQQYFQLLGASASECDTIPGRQCMASCFFILRQFDDVLVYLSSIEAYYPNDPSFLYNYALARVAAGKYKEAEPALLSLQSAGSPEEPNPNPNPIRNPIPNPNPNPIPNPNPNPNPNPIPNPIPNPNQGAPRSSRATTSSRCGSRAAS